VPETRAKGHLFLTMVERDVPLAQSLVSELRKRHGLGVDVALVSDRFDTVGAHYIRSSLVQRMNRSSAALCLLGEDTLRDPWVVWMLGLAYELRRRVLAAPLLPTSQSPAPLVKQLDAIVVPPRPELIVAALRAHPPERNPHKLRRDFLDLLAERIPSLHLK
jgi:hypothetical protein